MINTKILKYSFLLSLVHLLLFGMFYSAALSDLESGSTPSNSQLLFVLGSVIVIALSGLAIASIFKNSSLEIDKNKLCKNALLIFIMGLLIPVLFLFIVAIKFDLESVFGTYLGCLFFLIFFEPILIWISISTAKVTNGKTIIPKKENINQLQYEIKTWKELLLSYWHGKQPLWNTFFLVFVVGYFVNWIVAETVTTQIFFLIDKFNLISMTPRMEIIGYTLVLTFISLPYLAFSALSVWRCSIKDVKSGLRSISFIPSLIAGIILIRTFMKIILLLILVIGVQLPALILERLVPFQ